MPGVSEAQLAKMREQVNSLLPNTAVIQAVSNVNDGAGGQTPTWAAVSGGTVGCRLDPLSKSATAADVDYGRETLKVMYRLTVPYDAPLQQNRRVVVDGNTYEVIQMEVDHSWNVSKRGVVAEVR